MPPDVPAVTALRRIAFLLELAQEPRYRVRAFRRAANVVSALTTDELQRRIREGSLQQLPGIGAVTALAIAEARPRPWSRLPAELPRRLRAEPVTARVWAIAGTPDGPRIGQLSVPRWREGEGGRQRGNQKKDDDREDSVGQHQIPAPR